jgi:hypothetical protein
MATAESRMVEQHARKHCPHCNTTVLATRSIPADTAVDPFVVLGTFGLALLFRKTGLDRNLEPFRCPACDKAISTDPDAGAARTPTGVARPSYALRTTKSAAEYVDRLRGLAHTKNPLEEYNRRVKYGIQLYYGNKVSVFIDKLVTAGDIDRALKLLAVARPYKRPRFQRLVLRVVPLVLEDLMAIGLLIAGAIQLAQSQASTTWPTVEGTVLQSRIDSTRTDDGMSYKALVNYRYQVNEVTYEGRRVSLNWLSHGRNEAIVIVERFMPGAAATVYYDRANPSRAVLIPGIAFSAFLLIGAGIAIMIGSAIAFPLLLRKPLRELRELEQHTMED